MSYLIFEFKKAFLNKWFLGTLLLMSFLAIACSVGSKGFFDELYPYLVQQSQVADPDFSMISLFSYLLFNRSDQASAEAFYMLLPLAAVLPYSWSLCSERKSTYLQNIYTRIKRSHYILAKSLATFLCGFLVISIPLTLNIVVSACFIPAFETDISTILYSGISDDRLWSSLYYGQSVLYCVMFVLLNSCFAGLWAVAVQAAGAFISRPDKLLASSYVLLYCIQAFEGKIWGCLTGTMIDYYSASPLDFLRGVSSEASCTSEMSFIPWLFVLAAGTLVLLLTHKNRDEL